jgi:hypothetical protein
MDKTSRLLTGIFFIKYKIRPKTGHAVQERE